MSKCIYCKQRLVLPVRAPRLDDEVPRIPLDGYVLTITPCPKSPWSDQRHQAY